MTKVSDLYIRSGLSVIPCGKDKKPQCQWTPYKDRLPKIDELSYPDAIGIVCGKVSGGLEVVDVDLKNDPTGTLIERLDKAKELHGVDFPYVIQKTPSGGCHLIYKCPVVEGNQKLAQSPEGKTLIETRGEGGYILAAPSAGYEVLFGDLLEIPLITIEQREALLGACRSLNAKYDEIRPPKQATTGDLTPWEDFNQRADVPAILQKHGWTFTRSIGENQHYCRPDKTGSTSGTWNGKTFYCFTSSTVLDPSKAYTPSALFTYLECGKDFSEAGRRLRAEGYGNNTKPEKKVSQKAVTIFRLTKPTSMERPKKLFGPLWAHGEAAFLFAEDGAGKTILAKQIGCAIATGTSIPGFQNELPAQPVTYFDAELSDYQFNTRYPEGLPENFKRFTFDEEQQTALINADIEFVVSQIEQAAESQASKVIILDNLSALASMLDLTKTQESVHLMGLLNDLKRKGYSVLVIDHTRKPMHEAEFKVILKGDLQGSKMKSNLSDSVFSIGKSCQGENIRYIKALKIRSFEMTLTTKGVATVELRTGPLRLDFLSIDPEWQHVNNESMQIHKSLSEGLTQKQIAEKLGMTQQAVSKRIKNDGRL